MSSLKSIFRKIPRPVAVVTMGRLFDVQQIGLTISDFEVQSMSPEVIRIGVMKSSLRYKSLINNTYIGLNILSQGQEHLSELFAKNDTCGISNKSNFKWKFEGSRIKLEGVYAYMLLKLLRINDREGDYSDHANLLYTIESKVLNTKKLPLIRVYGQYFEMKTVKQAVYER